MLQGSWLTFLRLTDHFQTDCLIHKYVDDIAFTETLQHLNWTNVLTCINSFTSY